MSEKTPQDERAAEREKVQLKRPPGVTGEMHPERFLEKMRRWREEGSLEEEERIWRQFEPSLRNSNASYPEEEEEEA